MKKIITIITLLLLSVSTFSQSSVVLGPASTTEGSTETYFISGVICPTPDNANYTMSVSPSTGVTLVKTADNSWDITFSTCGNYTVYGLRPCGGFTTGSTSVTVTGPIPSAPSITGGTICSGESLILTSTACSSGNLTWYTGSCGGTLLGTGSPISSGNLTANTTFYARCEDACGNSTCDDVLVTVQNPPSTPTVLSGSPNPVCEGSTTTLSGNCATGLIRWYNLASDVGVGISSTQTINAQTKFYSKCYESANLSSCQYSLPDSIIIDVYPVVRETLNETICFGSAYFFDGQNLSVSNTYIDTLNTSNGCDSIVTLNLTVDPIIRYTFNDNVCFGGTYNFGGNGYTTAGSYSDTLVTTGGCDSISTVNLTVDPIIRYSFNDNVCFGGTYNFGGNAYTSAGSYSDTLVTVDGCDSISTVNLTVDPIIRYSFNDNVCFGGTYNFGGNAYTSAGSYSDTLVTVDGCDSISTLVLTVDPIIRSLFFVSICNGQTYGFNGRTLDSTGFYSDTLVTPLGCDSISSVSLTENPIILITLNETICFGSSFDINGTPYSTSGTFQDTSLNIYGCEEITTLNLTVDPIIRDTINENICSGSSYNFGGAILNTPGTYDDTLKTAEGCDSISTLNLSITPVIRDTINENICFGTTYNFDGTILNVSGIYNDTLITPLGCDSISTLNLIIDPVIRDTIIENICSNSSFNFGGTILNVTGVYNDTLITPQGCDSISTLDLTVDLIIRDTLIENICFGSSYNFSGTPLNITGIYNDTLVTASGCDSISTLDLTINPIIRDTLIENICFGSSYNFGGTPLNVSGIYNDTLVTASGCDSISTLDLTIDPIIRDTINESICSGSSFNFGGTILNTPGTYSDTIFTVSGCDSISTINLTLFPYVRDTLIENICFGSSYNFGGTPLNITGIYSDTIVTASGCDSISTVDLTIDPIIRDTIIENICFGSSYNFGGTPLNVTGIYSDTLVTASGCDSISTIDLTIDPIIRDTIIENICFGSSYNFGGTFLNITGIYSDTLVTASGCDSISTVDLTIDPIIRDTIIENICFGSSYNFGGTFLNITGIYSYTIVTTSGCDSISTIDLTIDPIIRDTIIENICFGSSYNFGGTFLNITGIYSDTIVTTSGCDSISTIDLTIDPIIRDTIIDNICFGSSYNFGGTPLSITGIYSDTIVTASGCDSISTLDLTIDPIIRDTIIDNICFGSSYNFGGTPLSITGIYSDTIVTASGCDSISTIDLKVDPVLRDTIIRNICFGSSYSFGGVNYSNTGVYNDTVISPQGCDSISSLNLTIDPIIRDTIIRNICFGSSYNFGGTPLNVTGIYSDTIVTASGCDSISTLDLTIDPIIRDTINVSICYGTFYNFGGAILNRTGTYNDTLITSLGCDSISTLNLIVNPLIRDTTYVTRCNGGTYNYRGNTYTSTGNYSDSLVTASGCDSIVTLSLIVLPIIDDTINAVICSGNSYDFGGKPLTISGLYSDTLLNYIGCDSTITINLFVEPTSNDTIRESICMGDSYFFRGSNYTTPGVYSDSIVTASGCYNITSLDLSLNPVPFVEILGDSTYCVGESTNLFIEVNHPSILWDNGDISQNSTIKIPGIHFVTATDINLCSKTDSIFVIEEDCIDPCIMFVPNAFSPELKDNLNDEFKPHFIDGCDLELYEFYVFDRWGRLIFRTEDRDKTWDGTYKNKNCKVDTYIWKVKYKKYNVADIIEEFGHVTITK